MEQWYEVISSSKTKTGIIIHNVQRPGYEIRNERWADVRMGLCWPFEEVQGGFVVVGQEAPDKFEEGEGRLFLLAEHIQEGFSNERFFGRLTDIVSLMLSQVIYLDRDLESTMSSFMDYLNRMKLSSLSIVDAPYKNDVRAGFATVLDWRKSEKLILEPTSQTREQLKGLERMDFKEAYQKLPLANSLRHVCAGFRKYPVRPGLQLKTYANLRGGQGGWMQ